MAKVAVVDEQDNILSYKDRDELTDNDIRRITSLHLFNTQGQYLVARRHLSKKVHPGKWGPSVAGTVEEGETFESNIKKEAKEELGLTDLEFTLLEKTYYQASDGGKRFRASFLSQTDKSVDQMVLQESEVIDARWVSLSELYAWFEKSPDDFVPSFDMTINFLKKYETQRKS